LQAAAQRHLLRPGRDERHALVQALEQEARVARPAEGRGPQRLAVAAQAAPAQLERQLGRAQRWDGERGVGGPAAAGGPRQGRAATAAMTKRSGELAAPSRSRYTGRQPSAASASAAACSSVVLPAPGGPVTSRGGPSRTRARTSERRSARSKAALIAARAWGRALPARARPRGRARSRRPRAASRPCPDRW